MTTDAPLYLILDLETTGLDPEQDMILEVAWAITDDLQQARQAQIFQALVAVDPGAAAQQADPYVRKMHEESGLWDALESDHPKSTLENIEDAIVNWSTHIGRSFERPLHLVGNSIGSLDLPFIKRHMPLLAQRLHYRVLDLTSVNLLIQGIGGPDTKVDEPSRHRAADDVRLTIKQMQNQIRIVGHGIDQL